MDGGSSHHPIVTAIPLKAKPCMTIRQSLSRTAAMLSIDEAAVVVIAQRAGQKGMSHDE